MLRFDKATYLSLLFNFILSNRLSNSLWGSDVLLFPELINIVSILFYNFVEFTILLYTFVITSFAQYRFYIICLISFCIFLDAFPAFTCASAIDYFWSICFGVNFFSRSLWFDLSLGIYTLFLVIREEL